MRHRVVVLLSSFLSSTVVSALAGIAVAGDLGSAIATKLGATLPLSWAIVERRAGVVPEGHYWGREYNGIRGEELLLQGNSDVHISWQDYSGEWHNETVGKEALRLYVMPPTYRESLLRHFIFNRPVAAKLLAETPMFKLYAYPSTRILEKETVERVIKHGRAIRWPDSPEVSGVLSWETWRADLSRVVKAR